MGVPALSVPLERAGDGAAPSFFESESTDRLMQVCIELGAELWVVKQRLALLEERLEERQLLDVAEMERSFTEAPGKEGWRARRQAFVQRVFGPLGRAHIAPQPPVAARERNGDR